MEDLVYFARASVSLDDVARLARESGFRPEMTEASRNAPELRIFNGGKVDSWHRPNAGAALEVFWRDDSWIWCDWQNWRAELIEEPDAEWKIAEYDPTTVFLISYRPGSLPCLKGLLKSLLCYHGGWVADDEGSPPFDVETIDNLAHHRQGLANGEGRPL
jgi:hypothetical protein